MTTESQQYNCFIRNGRNAIHKHACPEAEGNNSITGLNLLWARNPYWQVSQEEAGRVIAKRRLKFLKKNSLIIS
jgi:hypothetical protein